VPKVDFEREGVSVEARAGQTLLEVAESAGIDVFRGIWPALHCKSRPGWCNRCKLWVHADDAGAINPPTAKETARLRLNGRVYGEQRLACQVRVSGDVRVHTRAGGPIVRPSLAGDAPAWKNALSQRPVAPAPAKPAAAEAAVTEKPQASPAKAAVEVAPALPDKATE
jgi:ferredoxin